MLLRSENKLRVGPAVHDGRSNRFSDSLESQIERE